MEFNVETYMISWIEGILEQKALRWHQARITAMVTQYLDDNSTTDWAVAEVQLNTEYKSTKMTRKTRSLKYMGYIAD
jgi:hypothetical protein